MHGHVAFVPQARAQCKGQLRAGRATDAWQRWLQGGKNQAADTDHEHQAHGSLQECDKAKLSATQSLVL
jgi:hypothetical protein